jgi:hypothetical protein
MQPSRIEKKVGAAMIESSLVIVMLCLILFGILQVSYLLSARDVLSYTAIATARSSAIGLNDFMLEKVSHYTSIPTAGPIRTPNGFGGFAIPRNTEGGKWDYAMDRNNTRTSSQGWYEVDAKEEFHLAGQNAYRAVLDYDNWQLNNSTEVRATSASSGGLVSANVSQDIPLVFPFSRVFFGHLEMVSVSRDGGVGLYPVKRVEVEAFMEDHAGHYLQDE